MDTRALNLKTKQGWKNFIEALWIELKGFGWAFRYAWRDTFFN